MIKNTMKKIQLAFLVVALLTMSNSYAYAAYIGATNIMQQQQKSNWCWAASACSVIPTQHSYWKPSQPEFAMALQGNQNDNTATITAVGNTIKQQYDISNAVYAGTLAHTTVKSKIDSNKPIIVRVAWSGGGGHMVVVSGYYDNNNNIYIMDPANGWLFVLYSDLVSNYPGGGTWTHSLYF